MASGYTLKVLKESEARCHWALAHLSMGYSHLGGTYQGVTDSFAANAITNF